MDVFKAAATITVRMYSSTSFSVYFVQKKSTGLTALLRFLSVGLCCCDLSQ